MLVQPLRMNVTIDPAQLEALAHLNKTQKRHFILREQLKYHDPQHLDLFIDGIANPEPPVYRHVSDGVTPPLQELSIKERAKTFHLGNVQFNDGSVRRIRAVCVGKAFEIRDDDHVRLDDEALESVAISPHVAELTMGLYRAKYEALHERVQTLNETRKHAFEEALKKPVKATMSQFKDATVAI